MANFNFDKALKLLNMKADDELNAAIIKKAYMKAALKWHPDKNTGDQVAADNFKSISEAYDLLTKIVQQRQLNMQEFKAIVGGLTESSFATRIKLLNQISKHSPEEGGAIIRKFAEPSAIQNDAGGYAYGTYGEGRDHGKYTVTSTGLRDELSNLKGDVLKTAILSDFKASLAGVTDSQELSQKIKEFKNGDEYKLLAKGQGFTTHMFGLKTTSLKTFENIVAKKQDEVEALEQQSSSKATPK